MPAGGNGNGNADGNGNGSGDDALPVRIIVRFDAGANDQAISRALEPIGGRLADPLPGARGDGQGHAPPGLLRIALDPGADVDKALRALAKLEGVTFVEVDHILHTFDDVLVQPEPELEPEGPLVGFEASNDPGFTGNQTWGMYGDLTAPANAFGSQAGEAWAGGYVGSTSVVVGLIDTGVDYRHPDLYLNIWLNENEIPTAIRTALVDTDGDGRITFRDLNAAANASHVSDLNANGRIDAGDLLADAGWENGDDLDANGYVDDLIGWDFRNNDNDPLDDVGHGTHVAGILAAQGGNGVGTAGVSWNTQIVVMKFLASNGGFTSDAALALDYFTEASQAPGAGHFVATNNSYGGSSPTQTLLEAIERGAQADILFVAAAGNGGADQIGDNNDISPIYPANYSTTAVAGYEAVITVASITSTGARSSFSNFGATSVDLGAPGSSIYSTLLGGGYGLMSGTSMAAPFVTGAIALYAAADAAASATQIRTDLLASTTATASLTGITITGGRLDISSFVYRADPDGVTSTGTAGNDTIGVTSATVGVTKASVFDDTLSGLGGADSLNGGPGADRMVGGAGDDTYTLDNVGDVVEEAAGEGNDLVNSPFSFTLGANVERLTLTGTGATIGTGNDLNNTLTGNSASNTLIGGLGADAISGGAGADRMEGGSGDDSYTVDNLADEVIEAAGEGNDLVSASVNWTLGPNVERLTLTGGASLTGIGNDLDNTLIGNSVSNTLMGGLGNDSLNGVGGADRLEGGDGDDVYTVDNTADVAVELAGQGNDLVISTATYTLGSEVERLTLSGGGAVNGAGNELANLITGNSGDNFLFGDQGDDTLNGGYGADSLDGGAGNDSLNGAQGVDRMAGGAGDDTFIVDATSEVVVELDGEGDDLVISSATYTLSPHVERLTLTGWGSTNGTGNAQANFIIGSVTGNQLLGLDGADTLDGGSGDDTLDGGAGSDRLTGAAGADRFVLTRGEAQGDAIADFATGDRLELQGYGAGSTIERAVGSTTDWVVTDSATGTTETLTLVNGYALTSSDIQFTNPGPPPLPTVLDLAPSSISLDEGSAGFTVFTYTVTRTGSTTGASTVNWSVTGSGANPAAASDFQDGVLPGGVLSFAAGETSKTLTIHVSGDAAVEADETFTVTLSGASGATIGAASAAGTIRNDDAAGPPPPVLDLAPSTVSLDEGSAGSTAFIYTVTRTGSTTGASTVNWSVAGSGGNPAAAGDFEGGVLPSGVLSFAAGETSKTLTINVAGDATVETDETFTVTLSGASGATLGAASATGTIRNDDAAPPPPPVLDLAPSSVSLDEGSAGSTTFTYTVTRTGSTTGASTVNWSVAGSGANAAAASDFQDGTLPGGVLSFAAGETSKTLTIHVSGDAAVEADETFTVALSGASGATLGAASATGTIRNDDAAPPPSGLPPSLFLPVSGTATRTISGDAGGNSLVGTSAAEWFNAKGGDDTMTGAGGDDTFIIENAGDLIVEGAGGGVDTARSILASYTLPAEVENLTQIGFSLQTGFGNAGDNILRGTRYGSRLDGGEGHDMLVSVGGADTLTGGAGRDAFRFETPSSTLTRVTDFVIGEDVLDLRALLSAYGGSDPVADAWVRFDTSPDGLKLFVDQDGAGGAHVMRLIATLNGVSGPLTTGADWVFD